MINSKKITKNCLQTDSCAFANTFQCPDSVSGCILSNSQPLNISETLDGLEYQEQRKSICLKGM